ncbi:MAG TPA: RusA family crossover junction endodeoxyribonuclease [Candidatus Deferrimicrobiaceae bacterium]|nr:RusA family crossover junction endodeoxyribonuclease [Candidatus Deferrimicrobiaceae bacterium]
MNEYMFVIPGACPPKGSRTPVGKGRAARESSKRVGPWTEVALRAMRDSLGKPRASFSGPVYVDLTFTFRRPKVTEFDFPTAPNIGDVDKLCRTALDALTKAGVIEDDRFVAQIRDPVKLWAPADSTIIKVGNVTPEDIATRSWQISMLQNLNPRPPSRNPFADLGPETHRQQAERRIREATTDVVRRGPCACGDQCRGLSPCRMLT